jgi:hypothetical protein
MLTSAIVLGQLPAVPIATAAVAVQPYRSYTTAVVGCSQATTIVYTYRIPVFQLWEDRPLR